MRLHPITYITHAQSPEEFKEHAPKVLQGLAVHARAQQNLEEGLHACIDIIDACRTKERRLTEIIDMLTPPHYLRSRERFAAYRENLQEAYTHATTLYATFATALEKNTQS